MSGHDEDTPCPNCKKTAHLYTDWKPYDYSEITCYNCGFHTRTEIDYWDLETLNEQRESMELEPLIVLPEQNENV